MEVGDLKGSGRYTETEAEFVSCASFEIDFQPYSGGLAATEYGYEGEVTARAYCCKTDGVIHAGQVAVIDGKRYDVLYVAKWELGDTILLRQRRD